MRKLLLFTFLVSSICTLAAHSQSTQTTSCDSSLKPVPGRIGYGFRDNRCEGIYERLFGLEGIRVVSFDTGAPTEQRVLASRDEFVLAWDPPAAHAGRTMISARSIRHPYRMDATVLAGTARFGWSAEILANRTIALSDIVAAVSIEQGGLRVLVPARLPSSSPPAAGQYRLVVLPSYHLRAYQVLAAPLPTGTAVVKPVIDQPKREGYFGANLPIPITLAFPPRSGGLFRIRITSELRDGGTAANDITVFLRPR
jgi:hypothetical protein